MRKVWKRLLSFAVGVSLTAAAFGGVVLSQSSDVSAAKNFDPETVMWTNNMVENVDENYSSMDPNWSNKDKSDVQSPYAKPGEKLDKWSYAEFLWTHAYPIGNGRMGGMVAGAIDKEIIQINEDTIWSGSPYADLQNENGEIVSNNSNTDTTAIANAERISAVNQTSGSKEGGWRYFRGADANGNPAEIGSADAVVGDETFRTNFPAFANKSISNQALNNDNSATNEAVQNRYSMERMVESTFLGNPKSQKVFKSFVEVYLDFNQSHKDVTNYTKALDMETGTVTVDYDYNGNHFTRESFASYPDQTVATHIESDGDLNFDAAFHTYHNQDASAYKFEKVSDNELKLTARVTDGGKSNEPGGPNVIRFEAHMIVDSEPGAVLTVSDDNTTINISGGKTATIYVVGASNYVDYLNVDNAKPANDCAVYVSNVKSKDYQTIKSRHLADFSEQFTRTSLSLANKEGVNNSNVPTEKRIRKDVNGDSGYKVGADSSLSKANANGVYSAYGDGDNQLAALEFNYGKYLLISGSRPGRDGNAATGDIPIQISQPLTLAGKWNASRSASWGGKYTININTEMNYWPAQPLNLAENEKPLIETFASLAQGGSITAANQYGIYNDRGDDTYQPGDPWVMHHNYDLWRGTMPIDNATAGLWPTGGVWLLDHAWQYYQYNLDTEYLAEVYPYIKGAASFFTKYLVKDPVTGYLITAASCSPEQGGVQPGPAMDTQLVRNLYDTVQKAAKVLGKETEDADLLAKIAEQMPSSYLADEPGKVAPNLIDEKGLIKEWARGDVAFDFSTVADGSGKYKNIINPFTGASTSINEHIANNNNGHRHCSQLWEMFPGKHLSAYSENESEQDIFKAYQSSVSGRGAGSGQGWGVAWRINLNARALNGDFASTLLNQLFTTRTSPNLFDQHPNFLIDGNYGAASGITEMVMQSHDGSINLIPAIPSDWQAGSFKGLKALGGATVDLTWSEGKPVEAKVTAATDGELKVRNKYMGTAVVKDSEGNVVTGTLNQDETLLSFNATAGKTYTIDNFGETEKEYIEATWDSLATDAKGFFNTVNDSQLPKIESKTGNVGFIYNTYYPAHGGVAGEVGYYYPDCTMDRLKSLSLELDTRAKTDGYVSIRLDSKDGPEIAHSMVTATGYSAQDLGKITVPEGVTGKHDLYAVFYTEGNVKDKWVANVKTLHGVYEVKNPNYNPDPDASATPDVAPSATPSADSGLEVTEAEGNYTAAVSSNVFDGRANATVIFALYNDEGVLIDIKSAGVTPETNTAVYAPAANGNLKVMVWDDVTNMTPLVDTPYEAKVSV